MPFIHTDHHGHQWLANEAKAYTYGLDAWSHFIAARPKQRGQLPGSQRVASADIQQLMALIGDLSRAVQPEISRSWTAADNQRRKHGRGGDVQEDMLQHLDGFGQLSANAAVVLKKRAVLGFVGVPLGAMHPLIAREGSNAVQLMLCVDTEQGDILITASHFPPRLLSAFPNLRVAPNFKSQARPAPRQRQWDTP